MKLLSPPHGDQAPGPCGGASDGLPGQVNRRPRPWNVLRYAVFSVPRSWRLLGITAARTRHARLPVSCRALTRFPRVHGWNPGTRRGSPIPFPGNIPQGARGQAAGLAHVSFGFS